MDPLNPIFAVVCLAMALTSAIVWERVRPSTVLPNRIVSLDGLRGYLAFFVFIHHASIWYFYLRTGNWTLPPSRLYVHLSQSSIVILFMVTGFLFFSRILDKRSRVDWLRLYASRLLRLVPLYVLMVVVLLAVTLCLTGGVLRTSVSDLLVSLGQWLGFTMFGAPDLNGVANTGIIVSGVTWALPYEIAFYMCLPGLALCVGSAVPRLALVAVLLPLAWCIWFPVQPMVFAALSAGMAAAVLARVGCVRQLALSRWASLCVFALVAWVMIEFPSAYAPLPIALLGLAFTFVACGNDLFGILSMRTSQSLGVISYGIFLIHGLALFLLFHWLIGPAEAKNLTAFQFWRAVGLLSPIIVWLAYLSAEWFERPLLERTDSLVAWLGRGAGSSM